MCNSRGFTDEQDDKATASTIDFKKIALKCIPSKLGRKGDPRMHKALEARLNDPKLSLFDALKIGGFEFHWEGDVSYDKDHVLLSQRKNQLSRRIRLFKQSHQKSSGDGDCANSSSKKRPESVSKRKTIPDDVPSGPKKRMMAMDTKEGANSQIIKEQAQSLQSLEPNIASLFQLNSNGGNTNTNGMHQPPYNDYSYPKSATPDSKPSAPNDFPGTVLSGESSSVSSQALEPMITSSSSLSSHLSDKHEKMNRALDLYSSDSSNFMKRCMLNAGFSPDEVESCKQTYLEFGERALENERMRLQTMKVRSCLGSAENGLAPAPMQAPTILGQSNINNSMIPSSSQIQFATGDTELMPSSDEAISLSQQTAMCRYYFNQSCQSNNFPSISMPQPLPHDISLQKNGNVGPRVLDLKDIEIEGDEWKSILQRSEPYLDRILGLNSH